jgi:catechol 2,3-dioxygenase-like lactoylglutathione lyase family enzyme
MDFAYNKTTGKITRLLSIRLPVRNVEMSVDWYKEHFGLMLLQVTHETAELAVVEDGLVVPPTLILTKTASNHRLNYKKNGRWRSMIMAHASNLEGLRDKMIKAGA